jgi:hypothetical protein
MLAFLRRSRIRGLVQYHGDEHLRRSDLLCFGHSIRFVVARVNSYRHVVCRKIISDIDLAEKQVP